MTRASRALFRVEKSVGIDLVLPPRFERFARGRGDVSGVVLGMERVGSDAGDDGAIGFAGAFYSLVLLYGMTARLLRV